MSEPPSTKKARVGSPSTKTTTDDGDDDVNSTKEVSPTLKTSSSTEQKHIFNSPKPSTSSRTKSSVLTAAQRRFIRIVAAMPPETLTALEDLCVASQLIPPSAFDAFDADDELSNSD